MTEDALNGCDDRVEPLLPQDVRNLRLSWWSNFDQKDMVRVLKRHPGISFRIQGENQYVIGSYWRGRPEIGLILEVAGSKNRQDLVEREVDRFRELCCTAVMLSTDEAKRNAGWFLQHGWQVLDEIVVYTRRNRRLDGPPDLRFPVHEFQPDEIGELLELERETFEYLWWSGREDFLQYVVLPEVRAFVLRVDSRMAGYVSFTMRHDQGYLDRLGIRPAFQGQGYGSYLLSFALHQMETSGARTVSLNTQITNRRAQQLYQKYGFVRTNNDERIYGLWLKRQPDL